MHLRIKEIRKQSHMSQTDLAKAIGASLRTVGAWERGENLPNAEQIWNCALALHSTPNDLMGWYIDHPRERPEAARLDPEHEALISNYDRCTPERRDMLMQQAMDGAYISQERPERDLPAAGEAE